jgi:DNA polymerase I-like protein with 3'-5' exonuclease and polymerase domains
MILGIDSEWGFDCPVGWPSRWEPVTFCAVDVATGERVSFRKRDPRLRDWIDAHREDLFIAHNLVAEAKYLLQLGIAPPTRWFDTFVAERFMTNRWHYQSRGLRANLSESLRRLGLDHMAPAEKETLRKRILSLDFTDADWEEIDEYCFSDCRGTLALYEVRRDQVPPALMNHWVEYLLAVAKMELRGMRIDMGMWHRILAAREQLIELQTTGINAIWPMFDGTTFKRKAFLEWVRHVRIVWPTKRSKTTGKIIFDLEDDTFKSMEGRHPFIPQLREARKTIRALSKRSLVIDETTGRHYHDHLAFATVTGRAAPKKFIWGAAKWMRWLILVEDPDYILVIVDFSGQEFAISAILSNDSAMKECYRSGDAHLALAILAGVVPLGSSTEDPRVRAVRSLYKTVNLALLYGQSAAGISNRLGCSLAKAERLVADHQRLFPVFWDWRERVLSTALNRRRIATRVGWQSRVEHCANRRTWLNFLAQSTGADIMRATVVLLARQHVRLLGTMHDGFLLSCHRNELADLREAVDYACAEAVKCTLDADFPLKVAVTEYSDRLRDKDGEPAWERICCDLATVESRKEGLLLYA